MGSRLAGNPYHVVSAATGMRSSETRFRPFPSCSKIDSVVDLRVFRASGGVRVFVDEAAQDGFSADLPPTSAVAVSLKNATLGDAQRLVAPRRPLAPRPAPNRIICACSRQSLKGRPSAPSRRSVRTRVANAYVP